MAIVIFNISNLILFCIFCKMTIGVCKKKKILLFVISIIQLIKIYLSFDFSPLINFFLAVLLNISVLSVFNGKNSKKVLLLFIYMCFSVVSEELGLMVTENVLNRLVVFNSINFYILNIISQMVLLMFIVVSSIILYTVKRENIKWEDALMLFVFPLSTIFFIIVSRYPIYFENINISFLLSVLLFIIATIVNCIELYKIQRNNQIRAELRLLKEKQKSDKEYYDLLLKKSEKEKQIMHDINKHDTYLSVLLNDKHYEDALEYLNQNIDSHTRKRVIITKNKTLDLIIETLKDKIIENKISLDISNVAKVDLSKVKEIDQCAIFANILENAIESCIRSKSKDIILTLKQNDTYRIIFKTENSCDKVNEIKTNEFATLKEEKFHGIGLKNVRECVQKYNGVMKTSFADNTFTTIIVLSPQVD